MTDSSLQNRKEQRKEQLVQWLKEQFCRDELTLTSVSGDASFRHYYRFSHNHDNYIAVDAPPDTENSRAFVFVAQQYASHNINVPHVISADFDLGFMCLSDLGDRVLLNLLNDQNVDHYYRQALDILPNIAKVTELEGQNLPDYDRAFLKRELDLFETWFLVQHLNLTLTEIEQRQLSQTFDHLITSALIQPKVGVHRDFHARNIMVTKDDQLAVIDFQDAVVGPVTYDAVSLLRDCYIRWPEHKVYQLLGYFKQQMSQHFTELNQIDEEDFVCWFDWMGLQRHIKVCGIFSRLYHRDGKATYLADLPRVVDYLQSVASRYDELEFFVQLINDRVKPAMMDKANG